MICRIWHGWTTETNADAYERLLRDEIFAGILRQEIPGFRAIDLLRRPVPDGVEFATVMWFDSIEAVQSFAGSDYEMAVVPPAARALLTRFETQSAHYTVHACRPRSGLVSGRQRIRIGRTKATQEQ